MRYFVLGGEIKDKIVDYMDRLNEARKRRQKFAKKHGATSVYGNDYMFDLAFEQDPPKGWKRSKKSNGYTPEDRKIRREMNGEEFKLPGGIEAANILGVDWMCSDMRCRTPGIHVLKDAVIATVHDEVESINGAKRISDLEFETMTKPGKKRSKQTA